MKTRDLVDVREAVRLTGLNSATIYRLARRQGQLRSFRVLGRALRFERSDLETLVSERSSPEARDRTDHHARRAQAHRSGETP